MKRVLVTGVNGFVGRHLAREMHDFGYEVYGIGHNEELAEEISSFVSEYEICDLSDPEAVSKLSLDGLDAIINLAGKAANNPNETEINDILRTNVLTHINLYDQLLEIESRARVIAVSTGALYDPGSQMPLTEDSPIVDEDQATPYVRSKLALEHALSKYKGSLDVIIARPFNHTGPGQQPGFLVPDWANRLLNDEPLDVGLLNSWRDFTDVRDVVRAYRLLTSSDNLNHRTYNIASSAAKLGYDVIKLLADELGKELPGPRTEGPSVIYGSHERLTADTGWAPEIDLSQTIKDFAAWRTEES